MPYQDPDATDPMTLEGVSIEIDEDDEEVHREMARSFIEEFLRMGYSRPMVLAMFKISQYAGPRMALAALGEAEIERTIDELARAWNGRRETVKRDEFGQVTPG
jgi:hypothetical protein